MNHRPSVITALIVLALPLGGCRAVAEQDSWSVGTCVRVVEGGGTTAVACTDPHTHKVIAVADSAEGCPPETDMLSQPADPDDGGMTTCFQSDTASN
jgi:uncharacterized lipoprotein NlpE involved in copper resistance